MGPRLQRSVHKDPVQYQATISRGRLDEGHLRSCVSLPGGVPHVKAIRLFKACKYNLPTLVLSVIVLMPISCIFTMGRSTHWIQVAEWKQMLNWKWQNESRLTIQKNSVGFHVE